MRSFIVARSDVVFSDVDGKSRTYFDKLILSYSAVWARTSQSSAN